MPIQPRTSTVTIYQGDYLDRIRLLERQYEAAVEAEEDAGPRTLDEIPESKRLADEHTALVAEAEKSALYVKLQTVRRSVYRMLAADHPPRTGDDVPKVKRQGDEALGVNAETFREALVPKAIVEITEGDTTRKWSEFSEDEQADFLDTLAESDFERLFGNAYGLVNGFTADPKLLRRDSQETTQSA